uniref:C-C motif chemokine receptor 6 n=1 Tax=Leptobrachium leishanense TaxID=445787 RepID=A0A8C5M5Z0_9ANUR
MKNVTDEYDFSGFEVDDNDKPCHLEEFGLFKKKFVPVAYALIFTLGLLGNVLVIVTFNYYKRAKSMTDVYLLNMAVADILLVLTLPFWAVYYHEDQWIFQDFMCKLLRSIYAINFNCSMILLACIAIDRYIAIVQVTKSFKFRNTAMAYKKVISLIVWVFSACLSSVTFYFNKCYKVFESHWVCEPNYNGSVMPLNLKFAVIIVQVTIGFFIPLLIMIFCYTFIIKTLLQAQNSQRHKAIRVIVSVVAVFLVCQFPYNVLLLKKGINMLYRSGSDCSVYSNNFYSLFITEVFAFCHCCFNPAIYAFVGVKFRNYFMKIMQDLWCVGKKYIAGNRSSRMSSEAYTYRKTSEVYTNEGGSSFTM